MKHLKTYKLFEKLTQDEIIDLYSHFMRILKIHENHFWKGEKISNDDNFKSEINKVFHKMSLGKKPFTEELYSKVQDYEKKLWGSNKIATEDSFGNSMWDVCDVIVEDPDTLNINRYIQDFSDEDVYVSEKSPYKGTEEIVGGLENKLSEMTEVEKLVEKAFDIAKEQYTEEIDIIDFAIEILEGYQTEYPHLSDELESVIEDWREFRNRF